MLNRADYSACALLSLITASLLLSPSAAFGRGGGGHGGGGRSGHTRGGSVHVKAHTRKDGTHVEAYTRSGSAAGSHSTSNSGRHHTSVPVPLPLALPLPDTDSPESANADDQLIEPDVNVDSTQLEPVSPSPSARAGFPLATCGDSASSSGSNVWYPVFINNGNLGKIQQQFCRDAVSTIRQDSKVSAIQVASFRQRDRATQFAQQVGGEVGQPTTPEDRLAPTPVVPPAAVVEDRTPIVSAVPSETRSPTALNTTQSSITPSGEGNSAGPIVVSLGIFAIGGYYWQRRKRLQANTK